MKYVVVTITLFAGGCALTTPAPGGPLQAGTYTQFQPSWAAAYGRATVTVDGARLSGNGQTQIVGRGVIDPFPNPVPLTIGVRQALGPHLEASADVGWVDSGVGLRVAGPNVGEAMPIVFSAGARTGKVVSFFGNDTYNSRLAVELYPTIHRTLRLLFSVGVEAGAYAHQLLLPEAYRSLSDAPTGPPHVDVVRGEVRLQTSVGLYWPSRRGSFSVALSPWILLDAAKPKSLVCTDCAATPTLADFTQTWGISLIVAPALGWAHVL